MQHFRTVDESHNHQIAGVGGISANNIVKPPAKEDSLQ